MSTIDLPLPPSVNALWRAGNGRVFSSKRYTAWRKAAGWELALQRPKHVAGPVAITVAAGKPDRRKRDLDNIAGKAVLDLLVAHHVIADDSMVAMSSSWDTNVTPGTIRVTVEPALVMACVKA